ncbi:PAS domain-containing protein [Pseudomonas nitroreducens]|uniref:PAS domain-containing protein n=1 Tax=Pseudomonas nitroreducens TaxID=46680 RepID=UPI00209E8B13|nr:PAS domain-containing protein [Pseudomonas nitroreducens]MCP1625299.1 PAS domain S-box-containing protein [Pseudomonas nitroreducens]
MHNEVVDKLPDMAWTASVEGRLESVNQAWRAYAGRNVDTLGEHAWQALVHPDDLPALQHGWRVIRQCGVAHDLQARLRRHDGVYRRFLLRARPLTDELGACAGWCGQNIDIDDLLPAAPAAITQGTQDLIDSIPALISLMTPAGELECVNRHNREYLGASFDELRRWTSSDTIHPDDLPSALEAWTHSVATGEPYNFQQRVRGADGIYRWFHVRALPHRDSDGRIQRWFVLKVDIDEQKRDQVLIAQAQQSLARALGEVSASEDRLRTLIDAVPGFVWRTDPDGSVEFLNQRWFDYTGMTAENAAGVGWMTALHPDDAPALGVYWQGLLEAGSAGEFEARLRRFDGSYRWFLIRAVPQLDGAGRVLKWYGGNTDIHVRKCAELLLAGEKRLLGLMAGGCALPQVLQTLCELVEANLEGSRCAVTLVAPRHGRSPEATLRLQAGAAPHLPESLQGGVDGQPLGAQSSPQALAVLLGSMVRVDDLAGEVRWPEWRQQVQDCGLQALAAMPVVSTDGEASGILSVYFTQPRALDENLCALIGQFTHLASIAIDRARSEAALRQSEAFLAKAQRISLTGTFSWRVDNDEIAWSEEIYRLLDLQPGLTPGFELIFSRIHPDDRATVEAMLRRQRRDGCDFEHEHRLLLPSGAVRHVHLVAQATREADGALLYIATAQDVTQRRLAEETLHRTRAELAHVARVASLGALTASIAHEVNQPLAGIITNASTCLRMLGAETPNLEGARETARRTIRDGNRAADVIKRLRSLFARHEAVSEQVDLNEATREVIAMLHNELQRHGVTVLPALQEGLPAVSGDRVQLQQVILNLILNAIDALSDVHDRPRQLRISTGHDLDASIFLAVRDNGAGFAPEDAGRLFDAFFSTKQTGMGIGLWVSRSIIEHHTGRVWATTHDGPGSTFIFALPPASPSHDQPMEIR